jgi:hypothetical protein
MRRLGGKGERVDNLGIIGGAAAFSILSYVLMTRSPSLWGPDAPTYAEAWNYLRFWDKATKLGVGVAALVWLVSRPLPSPWPTVLMGIALAPLIVAAQMWWRFRCPRCKKLFFVSSILQARRITIECRHCGLPKWAAET